jgi:hypothetical protein
VTEPTCTTGGYTTYTCACGDSYIADEIPALGHEWNGTSCTRCDATRNNPFVDVPEDSWFINPVLWAVEKGITSGVDDTHFGPNAACTRAQVVTFLWAAEGKPEPVSTVNPFVDVKEGDWFFKAVLWAKENDITSGLDDTHFGPNQTCTREQVVTFLWAAEGKPEPTATEEPFVDVAETDWFYKAVLWAVENGITAGVDATSFGPNDTCVREQVVTFLYAAAGKPETTAEVTFTDVAEGAWYYAPVAWAVENNITSGIGGGIFGVGSTCTRAQVVTFLYAAK